MREQSKAVERAKSITWRVIVLIIVMFSFLYPFFNLPPSVLPEKPINAVLDTPLPNFKAIENVQEKKVAFFQYLLPEVERQNDYILSLRLTIKAIKDDYTTSGVLTDYQSQQMSWLTSEYRVDSELPLDRQFTLLLMRIDIIPEELVLVQAANESAWGTSRFAQQGFNFFGLWCFKRGCGFVPRQRDEGADHEVAKFSNLSHATYTYIRNLNRHPAYKHLREIRANLRRHQKPVTGIALSEGLMQYSERGEDYIEELQQMIRFNKEFIDL